MRTFQRTLLAGAVALAVSSPAAAQFQSVIVLGDSLSDAGYFGSRFTVNPGLVWAQDFGLNYGIAVTPSNQSGTDYAQGGARVSQPSASNPAGAPQRPLTTQIDELLKATPTLNPKAVYTVWIGANDLLQNLEAAGAGLISSADAQANVTLAALQTAGQLARLHAAGAEYIVIFNLPDVGKTPDGQASGPAGAAAASALAGLFNTTLNGAVGGFGFHVIPVNVFQFFNEVLANPASFGFSNTTGVACTTSSAFTCTTSTLVAPGADKSYLFADGVHPTPAAHAIIAQVVESMISGPAQMGTLADAPLRVEDANFRALDSRMWSGLDAPRSGKRFDTWAVYDYGSLDMQAGTNNGSGRLNTVAVGGDMKVNDRLLAGMMFAYTENNSDFGGEGGGFKLRQPVFTLYGGYGEGPWYLGATLGAGGLDYSDINRNIDLGPLVRNESGETRGYEYTARLLGGYWFKYDDLIHGPYARGSYTKAVVRQFSEVGTDSTALTYGQQTNDQMLWSVGWQVAGKFGNVRPYARATWEYDSIDKDRTVTASSNTLNGSYAVPVTKPDNSYALFNVGAAVDWAGATGFISGSGTAGRGDGNYWAITVGIRMPI